MTTPLERREMKKILNSMIEDGIRFIDLILGGQIYFNFTPEQIYNIMESRSKLIEMKR